MAGDRGGDDLIRRVAPFTESAPASAAPTAMDRWAAEARRADSAENRRRVGTERAVAAESASMASILRNLAEYGRPVGLRTAAGRTRAGRLVSVGVDFCAVALGTNPGGPFADPGRPADLPEPGGRLVLVPLHAVTAVWLLAAAWEPVEGPWPDPAAEHDDPGVAAGPGEDGEAVTLTEALAELAGDRPRVSCTLVGGEGPAGELLAVGVDVLTVSTGPARPPVYVSVSSVVELLVSG